jgi:hypothetical protein
MKRKGGVGRPLGGARTDPSGQPAENRASNQEGTTPDPGVPSVTVRAVFSKTIDGVSLVVDRERGLARVDVGAHKSYDLVGLVRKIADAIVGCSDVELTGDDRRALDFLREKLPGEIRLAEGWVASGLDNRPGAA